MVNNSPKETQFCPPARCDLTRNDTHNILATSTCFAVYFVFGVCYSSLGAAIPELASNLNRAPSELGITFASRGAGSLFGTFASAYIIKRPEIAISKSLLACIFLIITGTTLFLIAESTSYLWMMILFGVHGIGFGGIDMMVNCALPELWGLRAQPWMQGMHACIGTGAIVGPAFVGLMGYQAAFTLIALASFSPPLILLVGRLCGIEKGTECVQYERLAAERDQIPPSLVWLATLFYFIFMGSEIAFAGWVPTYALSVGVTDSNADAAYAVSIFWAAITFGRIMAVFLAIYVTSTRMLQINLTLSVLSSMLLVVVAQHSYTALCSATALYGLSISSIFPLVMTVLNDYGYVMDSQTTMMFMIGTTTGESIVPPIIGLIMHLTGTASLMYIMCICCVILGVIYIIIDNIGQRFQSRQKQLVEVDVDETVE